MMNWRDENPRDAYGPQSIIQGPEVKSSTISSAIEALDVHLKELGECVRHLQMLRDRVNGPKPQEVAKGEMMDNDKVPHSLISSIHMRRNGLAILVKALEAVTHELEQSI